MDLFLVHYSVSLIYVSAFVPVPYCFDYYSYVVYLESGIVIPPVLFCLMIALAIQVILGFHTNFTVCYSSVKNAIGILIELALNLWTVLVNMNI